MSQADWDRLQFYSRKVKNFSAIYTDYPEVAERRAFNTNLFGGVNTDYLQVHPSTYFQIAQIQTSALFPSLRHLHYNLVDKTISHSHIFLFLSPLLDSLELTNIGDFENSIVGPFLATLSCPMLSRIVLDSGRMSVDILSKNIVRFKQLRSLVLTVEVSMSDFSLWEALGTLPSLVDLILKAINPASHPAHAGKNPNCQSGGPKYFEALESLCVTGSFSLIQDLLDFIDSPYLKSIKIDPVIHHIRVSRRFSNDQVDNLFTLSMTIVTSKWSQSLKRLVINDPITSDLGHRYGIPKCLTLLADLHEMEIFCLSGWKMENMDDVVRRIAMSWPKLRTLSLPLDETFISLSTLRIIAENCPELRRLHVRLDTSAIPPFDSDSSRKSLAHKLEDLTVGRERDHPSITQTCQIQMARHLNFIFPYLESIQVQDESWSGIRELVKLCQDLRRGQ